MVKAPIIGVKILNRQRSFLWPEREVTGTLLGPQLIKIHQRERNHVLVFAQALFDVATITSGLIEVDAMKMHADGNKIFAYDIEARVDFIVSEITTSPILFPLRVFPLSIPMPL